MLQIVRSIIWTATLAIPLIGNFAVAEDAGQVHSFKFTLSSHLDMKIQEEKQTIDADTELYYTWRRSGSEQTLSFDSALVKVNQDGKQTMNNFMNREKLTTTEAAKSIEVPFDKAPDELKKILQDSFGVPVCKIQVDENGKEIRREVVASPGAKDLMDQGMIANARLFHPPFIPAQDEWSAASEISMGNGGFAKGKLTYKKAAGGKGGQSVKVTGTLTSEGFNLPGTRLAIKKAEYVVKGEQTFDPTQADWVSGNLDVDVSFEMTAGEKAVASAKGKMIVRLDKVSSKK
jgi:hypothetical protein